MLHISYLHKIHIATFLPFRAYNTDNQLIIDTTVVVALLHLMSLTSEHRM